VLEKEFVFEVLQYVYRWHFDQSYLLGTAKLDKLEIWARRLHPGLDEDDRSEFAELWIPAAKTKVELKRSDYEVPEMKLHVADRGFKVKHVVRQPRPPAARSKYLVQVYPMAEVREYLFANRTNRLQISENMRNAARELIAGYLNKTHPADFTEEQVFHIAPATQVCNDYWVFWETGRKVILFSADMDLSNAGGTQLGNLKMQIIDLETDVVVSTEEVPGSNAFVTKDWVGRLLFNCVMYGERLVRTPDEIRELRKTAASSR